jgi:hypothetical protein
MKYKLHIQTPTANFDRQFETLKTMQQYERRNKTPNTKTTKYTWNSNTQNWEPFVTLGNQILTKSQLQKLLHSLE